MRFNRGAHRTHAVHSGKIRRQLKLHSDLIPTNSLSHHITWANNSTRHDFLSNFSGNFELLKCIFNLWYSRIMVVITLDWCFLTESYIHARAQDTARCYCVIRVESSHRLFVFFKWDSVYFQEWVKSSKHSPPLVWGLCARLQPRAWSWQLRPGSVTADWPPPRQRASSSWSFPATPRLAEAPSLNMCGTDREGDVQREEFTP